MDHIGQQGLRRDRILASGLHRIPTSVHDSTGTQEHPGGSKIILKYAGRDATKAYEPIHPKDALDKHLPREKHLGPIDSSGAQQLQQASAAQPKTLDEIRVERARARKRPINQILSLQDMEVIHVL